MKGFWVLLISGDREKISFNMYLVSLTLNNNGILKFEWLEFIESIIHECGLSFVFRNQLGFDKKWLKNFSCPKLSFKRFDFKKNGVMTWIKQISAFTISIFQPDLCCKTT